MMQPIRRHAWFAQFAGILIVSSLLLFGASEAIALSTAHECWYCHDVHGAEGVPILSESEAEVLCLTCHSPGGYPGAPVADVHTNIGTASNYADFRATCLRCHNPHDNMENWLGSHLHPDGTIWEGINIKLVGIPGLEGYASIATIEWNPVTQGYQDGERYVVFEQLGTVQTGTDALKIHSFSDEDLDGNGIKDGPCEVCHAQTKYHCNGDPTNIGLCGSLHHTGEVCTQCHDHAANFLPPGS